VIKETGTPVGSFYDDENPHCLQRKDRICNKNKCPYKLKK